MNKVTSILSPKNITIVGASEKFHKNSGRILINLQKSDFPGKIYLVNPNYKQILGIACYRSLLDIENDLDIVCVVAPSIHMATILRDCVTKKVNSIVIISSGFSENGPQGIVKEEELKQIVNGTDIAVYGPNSPGFFHFIDRWGLSFSPRFEPKNFQKGSVGLISHGGSLGRAVLDANEKGLGFTYWLSPGNELDINTNDCFAFLIEDPATKVIILIVESVSEEERFFRLLHEAFLKQKPVLFLPIGHSEIARLAVTFHLGRNSDYKISWDIVHHPGLIMVETLDELVAAAWFFDTYPFCKGNRTVIFSWAGATSIYLADLCHKYGVSLPPLSEKLEKEIQGKIGIDKPLMNPLDLTTVIYDDLSKLTACLDLLHFSGEFDNIIVPYPFQVDYQNEILAKHISQRMKQGTSMYIPIFMSQGYQEEVAVEIVKDTKKPFFIHDETAIKGLATYLNYHNDR
ncbi:CoA-binding protein [Bacillaceae bacterium Marseille-Q3522]|nr:CoA-binding protein [Bacillaceae bacterium Marseille-Q3522]